jgi:hypothetical protein
MAVRRAALAAGVVLAVLAVGLALGWWQGDHSHARPAQPLSVKTWLTPQSSSFGDPLTARLEVTVDPGSIDPESIVVRPRFAPYRVVGKAVGTRSAGGVLRSFRYRLECLAATCLPGQTLAERRFVPARLSYRTADGHVHESAIDWPAYRVVSRLTSPDTGDPTARLRIDESLPSVSYRIDPGTLRWLLAAASGVLVFVAAVLVGLLLPRRRGMAAAMRLSPLEDALALVRASCSNGYPDERRKALGRLARELGASGRPDLADTAFRLAWSARPPSGEAASEFAEDVEKRL